MKLKVLTEPWALRDHDSMKFQLSDIQTEEWWALYQYYRWLDSVSFKKEREEKQS